jgi:predicted enzyme related to lactoylglutathione lyase
MTADGIAIHAGLLPCTDLEKSLRFYRELLGFEIRGDDIGSDQLRRITIGPAGEPGMSIVLVPPLDETRVDLVTGDLDVTFEWLVASGAEVVQEPISRPSGHRDCAFFDPAGNILRILELP